MSSTPDADYVAPDERPNLGPKAPGWGRHLHDCMHDTKSEVRKLRQDAAHQRMTTDGQFREIKLQLAEILKLVGEESDDGKGGKGLVGRLARNEANTASLLSDRYLVRGWLAAMTASAAIMIYAAKSWVLSLVQVAK